MKIEVYYSHLTPMASFEKRDEKIVWNDTDEKSLEYRFVWAGSDRDLDFDYTQDDKTLESVFSFFNSDKEPKNFVGAFRSLSIGDVVCLEDRCYLCQTVGWRRLENFPPHAERTKDESATTEYTEENRMKRGDRVRYFPNIWFENDFHDGTVIDDRGTVRFDDGFDVGARSEQDGIFLLSGEELAEMGVNYDEPNNQFTSRKEGMSSDDIALALVENRMQLAYEERSGALVWLQKDDGDVEFADGEKMKGYKLVGDKTLPLDVQAKMMTMLGQVAQYVAEHGLKKKAESE